MIELTLLTLILQGIPETVAMAAVVYALINRRFDWRKIFAVGVLQGVTLYLIRLLPLTFGIHIFLGIFTLSFYIQVFVRDSFFRVIKSSILAYSMLMIIEAAVHISVLKALNLSLVEVNQNNPLWILMGWPQVIALFGIAYFINRFRTGKRESDSTGGL